MEQLQACGPAVHSTVEVSQYIVLERRSIALGEQFTGLLDRESQIICGKLCNFVGSRQSAQRGRDEVVENMPYSCEVYRVPDTVSSGKDQLRVADRDYPSHRIEYYQLIDTVDEESQDV